MTRKKHSVISDYLKALIITSSQEDINLIYLIKQKLKINLEIFGDNSSNNFKCLNNAFSNPTLVSYNNFKRAFENQLEFHKGKISNEFKIFVFIDTPNYVQKQVDYFVNKEMFIDHWAYEYIHPIYSYPSLKEILMEVNLLSFNSHNPTSYSDQLIDLSNFYLGNYNTNINEFFDYCLQVYQNSNQI